MVLDLKKKYPRAACPKRDDEGPHTAAVQGGSTYCVDCGKALIKKTDPERTHPGED